MLQRVWTAQMIKGKMIKYMQRNVHVLHKNIYFLLLGLQY